MIRFVCISDLHAGARTSLLEDISRDQRGSLSPLANSTVEAISAFLGAANADTDEMPQLILLGDVLDLQFSDRDLSYDIAAQFLSALRQTECLDDRVIVTGGNHDHALWTDARLAIEAKTVAQSDSAQRYRDATPAFSAMLDAESRMTNALLQQVGFEPADFRYPNIGFHNAQRMVVLHHGHFVEAEYRLMSRLQDALSKRPRDRLSAAEVAAENAGWIDFFWSTIGDAGFSEDAEKLYQRMLTTTGFRALSERWANKMAAAILDKLPISKSKDTVDIARRAARVTLDATVGAFRDRERYAEVDSLTEGAFEGLKWYLEGPVAGQISDELTDAPDDLTFVFGHTHKPFARRVAVTDRNLPVKVYNSGGWTLNGPRLDNAEGASMILIDHDLNVAALRLFSTPRNGEVPAAHLEMLNDGTESANQLAQCVQSALDASRPAWDKVAVDALEAYQRRQDYLLRLTDTPSAQTGIAAQ